MKIAVVPWGDPSQWSYVKYCYKSEELRNGEDVDDCVYSFSTLGVISNKLGYKNIVIVVPWTLYTDIDSSVSIDDIEKKVCEYIEKYLCQENIFVNILVAPGVMRLKSFDKDVVYRVNLSDVRTIILYKLFKIFMSIRSNDSDIEVLFDATHGVNYFTLIVEDALKEVLSMLSLLLLKNIRLEIFNADPFRLHRNVGSNFQKLLRNNGNFCKPRDENIENIVPELYYHKLSKSSFSPWSLSKYVSYYEGKCGNILTNECGCGFDDNDKKILEKTRYVVASYRFGLLPLLFSLIDNDFDKSIDSIVDKAVRCWYKFVKIDLKQEKQILVTSLSKFAAGFNILLHTYAITLAVKNISKTKCLEKNNCGIISLNELINAKDMIYRGSEVIRRLIDREIEKLKFYQDKTNEKYSINQCKWIKYKELSDKFVENKSEIENSKKINIRDLIAHAGFHTDIIELKFCGNDLSIRIDSSRFREIESMLNDIIRRDLHCSNL